MRAERDTRGVVWWARLSGVVAGLAGLGVAGLVAWLVAPLGSPVTAVGELIIDVLPPTLVNFGKDVLGFADKPILIALIVAAVLALCGLAGQLEHRRRFGGGAVFALVAVLGVIGVGARSGASANAYIPTVIGLLLGYMIMSTLVGKLHRWQPRRAAASAGDGSDRADSPARRSFLIATFAAGVAGAAAAVGGQLLLASARAVNTARDRLGLPRAARPAAPVPAGADFGVDGLTPYVTPNDDFYRIDTALQVPAIDPDAWTLRITGQVANPIEISYADLAARPLVEHLATLTCVSNRIGGDLVGNALWLGYPIRELLAEAQPDDDADMVLSVSEDGWTAGTPLSALTDPKRQALLAIGMNGEPLPIEHGFPVRMVVPGLYGYVSATKWVTQLKVTTFAQDEGYWTPLGWSARGPIKLASRIDVPGKAVVDPGTVVVAGVAWAQHTGIAGVEVQVDDGAWQPAQLAETVGPDTWRQWRWDWPATSGMHTLRVRATDADGTLQVADLAEPAPDGATGYHAIQLKVR